MTVAPRRAKRGAVGFLGPLTRVALAICLSGALTVPTAGAESGAGLPTAYLSIIIDDLGNSLREGRRAVALPAPVACAILPHTTHADRLAREAHAGGKEVLLHLPMEPLTDEPPGPGVLDAVMPAREFLYTLAYDLVSVPHAVGVNNHMGSRLTQEPVAMRLLMEALRNRGNLFFVDSRTSPHSVAARVAAEHGVPVLARNVFLDNEPSDKAIRARLDETVAIARRNGFAIAIGHPHPRTLAVLEQWLPTIARDNARVVRLTDLLKLRQKPRAEDSRIAGAGT